MSILLGGLMISNVRYRTFKDFNFAGRSGVILVTLCMMVAAVSFLASPSVAFVMIMVLYIIIGMGGGLVHLGRNLLGLPEVAEEPEYLREPFEKDS